MLRVLNESANFIARPFSRLFRFMFRIVKPSRQKYQVFRSVVGAHAVDVMNDIVENKGALDLVVDDKAMLKDSSMRVGQNVSGHIDFDVTVGGKSLSAITSSFIRKFFSTSPSWISSKAWLTFVGAINHRFVACKIFFRTNTAGFKKVMLPRLSKFPVLGSLRNWFTPFSIGKFFEPLCNSQFNFHVCNNIKPVNGESIATHS